MTSLKVAVRVRPLTERESVLGSNVVVDVCGKDIIVTDVKVPPNRDCDHRVRVHRFTFDYGYWSVDPSSTKCASQKTVYEEFGRVVLNTLLEGYNSCVIAYGPSGSGKTYTMMGTKEENGLTPRICEGLFEKLTDQADNHLPFQIDISFMEIYNEQVFDLLQKNESGVAKKSKLRVREHPIHGPFVEGLTTHIVNNIDKVCDLLARGNENRVKAETHVHDRSTRSHVIFTIRCSQACLDESKPREVISKLHLVDLAGSEKAAPEFCNERVKEGGNINKSLVTLGNVISVLVEMSQKAKSSNSSQKRTFVPYRDSNLTWLLKDSLGGNSHTFMLAAISPSKECYIETVSTLRYAQRAQFVMNKPVVNEDPGTQMIRNLRTEVVRLKNLLWTAEKLNRAYVMKPLPEIVQLRAVMEESAKRVDALTKHWFEKWLRTYSIVTNKTRDNDEIQDVKQNHDLCEIKSSSKNQVASESYRLNLENRASSLYSDSAECIIFRNGVVGFSKHMREDVENQNIINDTLKEKNCICSDIPNNYEKNTSSRSITARNPPKIRSYSDNSLRRISNSAISPLLKSFSLSEYEKYPVFKYSWLNLSPSADTRTMIPEQMKQRTDFSDSKSAIEQISLIMETPDTYEPSNQLRISGEPMKVVASKGVIKADETTIPTNDNKPSFEYSVSNGDETASFAPPEFFSKILTSTEESEKVKYNVKSLNDFKSFNEDGSYSNKTCHKLGFKSCDTKTKNTMTTNIEKRSDENETEKCFQLESQKDISLPVRKTTLNKEFGFGEQVIQESRNLLEYLRSIDHESTESSPGCCSPRRKDSEIMSLLSFSSFDAPFLRSLDDLSCNGENEIELEKRKVQNNSTENCNNSTATMVEHTIAGLEECGKTAKMSANDRHKDNIETKRGILQKIFSYEDNSIDMDRAKNSFLFSSRDTDKLDTATPCNANTYKELSRDDERTKPNSTIQNLDLKTDFKEGQETKNKNLENQDYNESDVKQTELKKLPMKLTKENLDLLEEELNEKTQENAHYINTCIAFAQNLFDQKNVRTPSEPRTANINALTETENDNVKPKPEATHVSKVLKNEGRKVYDFGCWGKEYDNQVETKMRKVEDEMKEIEIMLGKHFEVNENKESEPKPTEICVEEILTSNIGNVCDVTRTSNGNCSKEWEKLVGDVMQKNSQNLQQNTFTFTKSMPHMEPKNSTDDQNTIDTFAFKIAKNDNSDELGQDCESDFNDALTLDSLDNFEAEMKAWAEKYLTKYESQNSNFTISDKIVSQEETEKNTKEIFRIGNSYESNINNTEDESMHYKCNDECEVVQPFASNSICSIDSSSSDSITYVFVGKGENETQKIPEMSKSHCSSLISSVSLDSLEKTSLQYKPSFMSPRTLSIDSLVAEDLLEQLKKGRLPSATKQNFYSVQSAHDTMKEPKNETSNFQDTVTSFSNFRLPEKQDAFIEHSVDKDSIDPLAASKQTSYTLNSDEKTFVLDEHSFCLDLKNNYSFMNSRNSHVKFDDGENYARASENTPSDIYNILKGVGNCDIKTNEVADFSNSTRKVYQRDKNHKTAVSFNSSASNLQYIIDKSIHDTNSNVESEEDRMSEKLSTIFIPPPSSFDKVESIDGNTSRCQSSESTAKNPQSVSRSTQTDNEYIQIHPPSVKSTDSSANYIDLTSRMIELMTETIKYLKEQKPNSRNCCSCCHSHRKHKKISPYASSESDSNSDHKELASLSYDRSRKKHLKQRATYYVKPSKKTERSQLVETKMSTEKFQHFLIDENAQLKNTPVIKSSNTSHGISDSREHIAERLGPSKKIIGSPLPSEASYPRYDLLERSNPRKSVLPCMVDRSHKFTIPAPDNAEIRLNSPKNHLQQLVEIRRRLVEETTQKKADQCCSQTHEISSHRRRSTSSSSEGYLSSVSSRGVFSRLSETATGSGGLDNHCKIESMLHTPTIKENGTRTRPKLLEVHKSNQSQGTANSSWQNTSADSGAFFMDSPLAERHDFPEADNLVCGELYNSRDNYVRHTNTTGKFEECLPRDFGTSVHDVGPCNIPKTNVDSSARNRISDVYSLYPVSESATIDTPRINLLEEFKQNMKEELTTEIRKKKLSGYSCKGESRDSRKKSLVFDSRADLINKLSDINYKVTREDIEHVLASVQADKEFLRKRRKFVLDKCFSPKMSVYSIPGSDDDLFPWDSYKQLPEPSLFIGTSA